MTKFIVDKKNKENNRYRVRQDRGASPVSRDSILHTYYIDSAEVSRIKNYFQSRFSSATVVSENYDIAGSYGRVGYSVWLHFDNKEDEDYFILLSIDGFEICQ